MNDVSLRTDEIISKDLETYGNTLYRLAYSYMKNMHDAEDIVQEVFIQLLKNIDIFENNDHKKSWLICVTRNICKNYDEYKDTTVLDAVMKLPVKYREIIFLYYYEGYKTAEISEITNQKESTVRSLLHRARNILKKSLKEEYDFE